jgi:tRNA A37 threonylcarbamoyladenosine biosynthesis protein TsaE
LENRYPLAAARPAPPAPAAPVDAPGLVSHFDLYRTDGRPDPELLAMMLEAREAGALVCVEWGGPVERSLVPCLRIELALLADRRAGNGRRVELRSVGGPWAHGEQIATAWAGERGGRA